MNNPRVVQIIVGVAVVFILVCGVAGTSYYWGKFKPEQIAIAATKTQMQAVNESTAMFLSEVAKTENAAATQTQAAIPTFTQTPTITPTDEPSPTPTSTPTDIPTPTQTIPPPMSDCVAKIGSVDRLMYPWPDLGQFSFGTNIPANASLKVTGKLADRSWYQVNFNGKMGWLQSKNLILSGCQPNQFDLHYLQNWVGSTEKVVIDDTFAQGRYEWVTSLGQNLLTEIGSDGEGQLTVTAGTGPVTASTIRLQGGGLPAFTLRSAFTRSNPKPDYYVGVRFRDNGASFYQIQLELGPDTCQMSIYATSELLHSIAMPPIVCYNAAYDFELSITNDNKLQLKVNGYEIISAFSLPDPNGIYSNGNVGLVVNDGDAVFDFIVVTAPQP